MSACFTKINTANASAVWVLQLPFNSCHMRFPFALPILGSNRRLDIGGIVAPVATQRMVFIWISLHITAVIDNDMRVMEMIKNLRVI